MEEISTDSSGQNQNSTPLTTEGSNDLLTKNFREELDKNSEYLTAMFSKFTLSQEQNKQIKELLKEELNSSVSEIKSDLNKEGQEIKKDFLTIFGLFASFVTFLSIEVQVFKNKDNIFELIGITSVSLAFVMFFALVINDISKDKSSWSDFLKPTYVINIFFAIIGIIFLYIGATCSINKMDETILQVKKDSIEIAKLKTEIKQLKDKKNTNLPQNIPQRNPTTSHN
jgi:hypothetical protein